MDLLIASLKTWGDEYLRSMSARLLGELGAKAIVAKPHLQEALPDGVRRVRDAAATALEKIDSEAPRKLEAQ